MKVIKVNASDLKALPKNPILKENCNQCPVTIVNENLEVLFGFNYSASDTDMEVLQIDCGSETKSQEIAFFLHHIGMRTLIDCKNFNDLNNLTAERLGAPYGLFMYNMKQFGDELRSISAKLTKTTEFDLF